MSDRHDVPDTRAAARTVPTCQEYRYLVNNAGRCDEFAAQVSGNDRAVQLLTATAGRCREVAAVFDHEPALHIYLRYLPYCRAIDLLGELARQLPHIVRQATRIEANGHEHPRYPTSAIWAEAEALAERVAALAADAVSHPPALRLNTADGSRALSRRLIGPAGLADAAGAVEQAIALAAALPHPDPAVDELTRIAEQLRARAVELDTPTDDWWTAYFERALATSVDA